MKADAPVAEVRVQLELMRETVSELVRQRTRHPDGLGSRLEVAGFGACVLLPVGCYYCFVAWRVVRHFSAASIRHLCAAMAIYVFMNPAASVLVRWAWGSSAGIALVGMAIGVYFILSNMFVKRCPSER